MASDQPALAEAKASLRRGVRAARAARPPERRRAADAGLAAKAVALLPQSAARIACYVSLADEPGTASLIVGMLGSGHRVWVPRIEGADLGWVEIGPGTDYRPGPMGIAEPTGESDGDLAGMAVILMPATAVDSQGNRLGQGGGFYDRALATVPASGEGGPLRVALVFDEDVVEVVPADARDQRVDAFVTPTRAVRIPARIA